METSHEIKDGAVESRGAGDDGGEEEADELHTRHAAVDSGMGRDGGGEWVESHVCKLGCGA